ncbi:decarboxylating NADP(+)-dependent phosphogluconate dehydrogenase [Candidatus Latescibacterota bacterium]
MMGKQIGIIGLGVMGQNLTLNIESRGFSAAGFDLNRKQAAAATAKFAGKDITVADSIEKFARSLDTPKIILMMVPSGKPVDSVIHDLKPYLSKGDILIDGGNSFFKDTERRCGELEEDGILYIGTGVSGGEEGALLGPSIMPGGNSNAWPHVESIFKAIAAKVDDGTPCCEWIGDGGAGHFVKMVHNGIEYGDMQMVCEAYFLMKNILGLTPDEMHTVFNDWNAGELESYLIEITGSIMAKTDPETGKPMIDVILDTAGQKGTGKWTSQASLDLGVPAQTIAEAVFARAMSAMKEERICASKILSGPEISFDGDRDEFIEMIRKALYASKICSYAQGFQLMRAASEEYGWNLHYGSIAMLWRAGCIIRAQFLDRIKDAFDSKPDLANILLDSYFISVIEETQEAWRTVIAAAVKSGIPVPAFSSALAYYDSYRTERLPANLLQAQRDYFGAHTYERIDKERGSFFHTEWL